MSAAYPESIKWRRTARGDVDFIVDGLTPAEAEAMLLTLAADLHQTRTGIRAGAVIIESGHVAQTYMSLREGGPSCDWLADVLRGLLDPPRGLR